MTPAEAAADVVIMLIYQDIIPNTRATTDRIRKVTGINYRDLEEARNRLAKNAYRPFNVHSADRATSDRPRGSAPTCRDTVPRPPGMRAPANQRKSRVVDDVTELWCTGHDGHEAHWAPEDEFMRRSDRPHLRHTHCDDGRRSYQRARRVSLKALEQMHSAGITLSLDDDSNLVGIACKECGQPFQAGDHIEGDAVMRHAVCPTTEEANS